MYAYSLTLQYIIHLPFCYQNTHLVLICFVAPLVIMPLINLISIRSFWDWHVSWLGGTYIFAPSGENCPTLGHSDFGSWHHGYRYEHRQSNR